MPDDSLFGHALKLVDGDLQMANTRLVEIAGSDNLAQALQLRVLTPLASDIFNTTYGLDITSAFTEPNPVYVVKQIIKLNLVRTLATDTRVAEVRDILFEDDPDFISRHPEFDPAQILDDRHRRLWRVEVIIQTANNQLQSLIAALET
jgi:hypothetical protein